MLMTATRRGLTASMALAAWGAGARHGHAEAAPATLPGHGEWLLFRERFVLPEGRVVDTGNAGISHSEGQGWGLLMAEAHDDSATFARLLHWTQATLARPQDALFAWRWAPGRARTPEDRNNATDGDLLIAWALLRAARRWRRPELQALAAALCADIARLCVRQVAGRTVLLAGATGFEHRDHVVVNPSYYVFPALTDLAALERPASSPAAAPWVALRTDGLALLCEARFGRWGLPADWLRLPLAGGPGTPARGWPAHFSYDAVRVPLYLVWAGLGREPAVQALANFANQPNQRFAAAWTGFAGNVLAPYPMNSGQRAVALLAAHPGPGRVALPSVAEAQDYYAAALTLLSHMAMAERLPLVG